ncbi:MAG: HAMP domain-containing protein, partial [Calditrichae bacterium]|nr:HAMP domain-containing protein [Calditrichia bacterium]
MNITLRTKLIILSTVLVAVIMGTVTYFFTIRELASKKAGVKSQIQRIAQNIATLQLLERQEWDVYQNYIDQLMPINKDIVYIAVYDDRNTLRAHTLNQELIVLESSVLTRRRRAKIIRQLERGAIAEESHGDLRTERVNIQAGDRVLGSVHVGFSLIDINEELQNGIRLNIGLALFFIVLFSGVSVLISRRLTKPLERLSKAMEAVNEGNLSQKVEPQTHDEIAQLTATFNEMIDGLQERLIIENLGYELSAIFRLERLVPLVRQRLKNAIGASNARLYIRDRRTKHLFHESTVSDEEKPLYPALHLSEEIKAYLWQHNKGFMIFSAPKSVIAALRHQHSQEDGLVIPMTVKDELFGLLFFALPPNQKQYSKKQMNFAATLARQAALALENALLYEDLREQERLKRELEIAREVQQKLLPRTMPEVDGFKFDGI